MSKNSKAKAKSSQKTSSRIKSLEIASHGIITAGDFANFMSALMTDIVAGKIAPTLGNAACNAGGKLLKAVEMQIKYGTQNSQGKKVLTLASNMPLMEETTKLTQ